MESTNKIDSNLSEKEKEKLNNYFQKNLGVSLQDVEGFTSTVKKDTRVTLTMVPEHHYPVEQNVTLKKGAEVKICGSNFGTSLQPLGYSNSLKIEVVNPQIEGHSIELSAQMEDIVPNLTKK